MRPPCARAAGTPQRLASAMLSFSEASDADALGVDSERVDHLLGERTQWRFPVALCLATAAVLSLLIAVALLAAHVGSRVGDAGPAVPLKPALYRGDGDDSRGRGPFGARLRSRAASAARRGAREEVATAGPAVMKAARPLDRRLTSTTHRSRVGRMSVRVANDPPHRRIRLRRRPAAAATAGLGQTAALSDAPSRRAARSSRATDRGDRGRCPRSGLA